MNAITIRDSTHNVLKKLEKPFMSVSDAIDHLLEIRGVGLRRRFGGLSRSTTLDESEETAEEARRSATFRTFDNRDLRLIWSVPAKTDPPYNPSG